MVLIRPSKLKPSVCDGEMLIEYAVRTVCIAVCICRREYVRGLNKNIKVTIEKTCPKTVQNTLPRPVNTQNFVISLIVLF